MTLTLTRSSMMLAMIALVASLCIITVQAALPPSFHFGTATAAYQIEGAWDVDGKQPSEWDLFSHLPGKIAHGDNGDVADLGYEFALADVELLSAMGVNSYRFSLSWSRIIDASGNVNPVGVAHYSALIDALLSAGITPFITLYHWDLPLQYGTMMGLDGRGWLNGTYIVPLYTRYAEAVFTAYGERVKNWIIFNEPHSFCVGGFSSGSLAPGRCSDRSRCDAGDATTEPYTCAHNVLLAWSAAVNLYRTSFAPLAQYGPAQMGMSLDASHAEPWTQSPEDVAAAQRAMIWQLSWWADPMILAAHDYPIEMREAVGDRLPTFTDKQKQELATAAPDFFGFNHYTSFYAYAQTNSTDPFARDQTAGQTFKDTNGQWIGTPASSSWLYVTPWGFPLALQWIASRYPGINIIVTENGVDVPNENNIPLPDVLDDTFRVNYLQQYLSNMTEVAIAQMQIPIIGYFIWSFMDNFEWADGYANRFGLHYVDYTNGCKRYSKSSVDWYASWIKEQKMITQKEEEHKHQHKGHELVLTQM